MDIVPADEGQGVHHVDVPDDRLQAVLLAKVNLILLSISHISDQKHQKKQTDCVQTQTKLI